MKKIIFMFLLAAAMKVNAQTTLFHTGAFAIATNDTFNLSQPAKGIYVGGTGDIKVDMVNGDTAIVFKAVPVGRLDIYIKKVYKTGTTATNIVGYKQ